MYLQSEHTSYELVTYNYLGEGILACVVKSNRAIPHITYWLDGDEEFEVAAQSYIESNLYLVTLREQ